MLQYQSLTINNFSGGISDNYKTAGIAKFAKLDNFSILENGSIAIRDGVAVLFETAADEVTSISNIDSTILLLAGKYMEYSVGEGSEATDLPVTTDLLPNFGADDVSMSMRWRNTVFTNTTSDDDMIKTSIYSDDSIKTQQASLPPVTAATVADAGAGSRLYAIAIRRTYIDSDDFTYADYSPEIVGQVNAADGGTINISGVLPDIATESSLFTDELEYAFYLTAIGGTTLFLAATSTNTSFSYVVDDTELERSEKGFFLSEEPKIQVPRCNYFTITNNTGYYLSTIEDAGATVRPYRMYQSVQGMPTSVIASAFKDFNYNGNGIGAVNGLPVVLTDNAVYRVEGSIGVDGSGSIREVKIQGSEGGISHNSIVNANDKLYYAGTDGLYVTDGYTAQNISGADLYRTYSSLIRDRADWASISGTFDRDNDIIYWHINGIVLALHLRSNGFTVHRYNSLGRIRTIYSTFSPDNVLMCRTGVESRVSDATYTYITLPIDNATIIRTSDNILINGESATVYRYSGEFVSTGFNGSIQLRYLIADAPAAAAFDNSPVYRNSSNEFRQLLFGTGYNNVMTSFTGVYEDVVADNAPPSTWETRPVDFDMLTAGINYGSAAIKKWVRNVTASIRSTNRLAVEPYVIVDDNSEAAAMKLISSVSGHKPFDVNDIYGRESMLWLPRAVITGKRHLPKGRCRCRMNQVGIRSTITGLYKSSDYSTATVVSVTDTEIVVAMDEKDGATMRFPFSVIDDSMRVKLLYGDFTDRRYKITAQSSDRVQVTIRRINEIALEAGDKIDWIIYTQPSGGIELMSLEVSYAMIANSDSGFKRSDDARSSYE